MTQNMRHGVYKLN